MVLLMSNAAIVFLLLYHISGSTLLLAQNLTDDNRNQRSAAKKSFDKYVGEIYYEQDLIPSDSRAPRVTVKVDPTLFGGSSDDAFYLTSSTQQQPQGLYVIGASPVAALYGTYELIEQITEIKFSVYADLLPDRTVNGSAPSFAELIRAHVGLNERQEPAASARGLLPFHDFAEGPDLWGRDDYKHLFEQMTKLKMNWLGLHRYGHSLAEPHVWTGLQSEYDPVNGNVAVPSGASYANTCSGGVWGGVAMNTSQYLFGAHKLFDAECFGADVVDYNDVGHMLNDVFHYGRDRLGLKLALGIEAGDEVPPTPHGTPSEYYRGTFGRINVTYPIDLFWIWTSEGWAPRSDASIRADDARVQRIVEDARAAHAEWSNAGGADAFGWTLGMCGWTLGPMSNRSYFDCALPDDMTLSSINERVGHFSVEPEYADVKKRGRAKVWSIPWLEDDPSLTGIQLWVARTLAYGEDALGLGAGGLLGIHWRTSLIAPMVTALARVAWEGGVPRQQPRRRGGGGGGVVGVTKTTSLSIFSEIVHAEFGVSGSTASALAEILHNVDSYYPRAPPAPADPVQLRPAMPQPTVWGPGLIDRTFELRPGAFDFVDTFLSFAPAVRGALNMARFRRWAAALRYQRGLGKLADGWRRFTLRLVDPAVPLEELSALRQELVDTAEAAVTALVESTAALGGLGTLVNLFQLSLRQLLEESRIALRAASARAAQPPCAPVFVGCFNDRARLLSRSAVAGCSDSVAPELCAANTFMSPEWCAMLCYAAGDDYTFAGVACYKPSICMHTVADGWNLGSY